MQLQIQHNIPHQQFVANVEGKLCVLKYHRVDDETLDYYSTFVPAELRGRQIAQQLVEFALNYAKENQCKIIPSCSFVKKYVETHPENNDLLK